MPEHVAPSRRSPRVLAWVVLALVLFAQPCFALRLTCAAVGRLFPTRCCCASSVRSCCAARAAAEHPGRDEARAPRPCSCELELPARPDAERPGAQRTHAGGAPTLEALDGPPAAAATATLVFLDSLRLARLYEAGTERPPGDADALDAPPRCAASLEHGLAGHLATLSALRR
ncbi:MAG: hypothetical protein IPJ77_03645 [Planctomycetes bacterium]|nr:hypothetical protein [Planctomycetota bacterium]